MSSSSLRDSLLASILAHPDDDALRLVYADALEEAGETLRAELIHVDLSSSSSSDKKEKKEEEEERAATLRREHREALAGPIIAKYARAWQFERGLVEKIEIEIDVLAEHGEEILRSAPIRRIALLDAEVYEDPYSSELGEALAQIEGLERVTDLEAIQCGLDRDLIEAWLPSAHLRSLRRFAFMFADEANMADLLANRAPLPALREVLFWMESGTDGDRVAELLAGSSLRRDLERIDISGCEIRDEGVRHITESPHLHSLQHLLFGSSHYASAIFTDAAMTSIAAANHLTKLTTLELTDCRLTDAHAQILATATSLPSLKHLNLEGNELTPEGFASLLRTPLLAKCETLTLRGNPIRREDVATVLESMRPPATLRVIV